MEYERVREGVWQSEATGIKNAARFKSVQVGGEDVFRGRSRIGRGGPEALPCMHTGKTDVWQCRTIVMMSSMGSHSCGKASEISQGVVGLVSWVRLWATRQLINRRPAFHLPFWVNCTLLRSKCKPSASLNSCLPGCNSLEALRAFCLQQLGMRGRVLDVFYVTSQTQEETELRLGIGFEKDSSTDDGNTPCLRFTLTHYDFIRQTIADQKQEASERGQLLGQRRGADSNEGITVQSAASPLPLPPIDVCSHRPCPLCL